MKIEEVIDQVIQNPICVDMVYKYRNSIDLCGWILRKPKFVKHDRTGVESASVLIYQIDNTKGKIKLESFSCMVYVKDLIEQLKKQENVCLVATVGKLRYSKIVSGLYSQVLEMKTIYELDIPLAEEWKKKNE